MEVEMKIRGLMMDPVSNMPIVLLKDVGTVPAGVELATGSYVDVRVTGSFPNSLVGEMAAPLRC